MQLEICQVFLPGLPGHQDVRSHLAQARQSDVAQVRLPGIAAWDF